MANPQVAVVTGANRGIGLELSRQLAVRGVHVVLTGRDAASGSAATAELQKAGLPVEFQPLDVTSADSAHALMKWLQTTHGGLDILVNNAGISMKGFNLDVVRTTLEVNFFGALRVTDALLPLMRPGGRIVMVSSSLGSRSTLQGSIAARAHEPLDRTATIALMEKFITDEADGRREAEGWPRSAYSVSKIGLNLFTAALARELKAAQDPRGILVNAVCPGWVRTRLGGASALRSVEEGCEIPLWLAQLPADGPTGEFFRDKTPAADW